VTALLTIVLWQEPTKNNDLEEALLKVTYKSDRSVEWLSKAQVVECAEDGFDDTLKGDAAYALYDELSQARYLLTAAFLLDVRTKLKRLSELCQRGTLLPTDVNLRHEALQGELDHLASTPGAEEASVRSEYNSRQETFKGIAVPDWESATEAFEQDKKDYLAKLKSTLAARIPLKGPVHEARDTIFNHKNFPLKKWPPKDDSERSKLQEFGDKEIKTLVVHFQQFWDLEAAGCDDIAHLVEAVQQEFAELKIMNARDPKLQELSPKQFWSKIFTEKKEDYPRLHTLVNVERKLPLDTSECERWFSLMNRLKTKWRNRLSNAALNDSMTICLLGPKELTEELLTKAIAKWHAMSRRGRYETKAWKNDAANVVAAL